VIRIRSPLASRQVPGSDGGLALLWSVSDGSHRVGLCVAVDRLEKAALVKRKKTDDRRVRLVELTAKGRALITTTFREHAAAMEEAAGVLSKEERRMC
jgi:hypothetical protein